ncbi:hypothetical protein [Roseomonas populi]|uniref:Twin-arginine translocation signal domain-containing protein n=1 Tax=Roseomonas populi TaxID=3121582 RepID=A0ABT1WYL5_9PROT|nr:hypothetical protein [Roseomonas pecuniae]MCR0980626.1 hypothetical protein [Roseomonas pecuniae]
MSRRQILAGFASAAVGLGGVGAQSRPLPANDARLLALKAALARADQWHELCALDAGRDFTSSVAQAVAEAAQESALDAWEAVLFQMAETPAAGMVGVAVKAEQVALAVCAGSSAGEKALAESLRADLARLVPGVVTA